MIVDDNLFQELLDRVTALEHKVGILENRLTARKRHESPPRRLLHQRATHLQPLFASADRAHCSTSSRPREGVIDSELAVKGTETGICPLCDSIAELEGGLVSGNEPPFGRVTWPTCQTYEIADDVEARLERKPAMKARAKFVAAASRREAL